MLFGKIRPKIVSMFKLLKNTCSSRTGDNGLFGWSVASLQNSTLLISSPFIENTVWRYDSNFNILGNYDGPPSCSSFGYSISTSGNNVLTSSQNCQIVSLYQSSWVSFPITFDDIKLCGTYITVISSGSLRIFNMVSNVLTPVDYTPISATSIVCDKNNNIYTFGAEITYFTIGNNRLSKKTSVAISTIKNAALNDQFLVLQYQDKLVFYDKSSLSVAGNIDINSQYIATSQDGQFISVSDPSSPVVTLISRNVPNQIYSDDSKFLKPKSTVPYYILTQLLGSPNTGFGRSMAFTDSNFIISYPLGGCVNIYSISTPCILTLT